MTASTPATVNIRPFTPARTVATIEDLWALTVDWLAYVGLPVTSVTQPNDRNEIYNAEAWCNCGCLYHISLDTYANAVEHHVSDVYLYRYVRAYSDCRNDPLTCDCHSLPVSITAGTGSVAWGPQTYTLTVPKGQPGAVPDYDADESVHTATHPYRCVTCGTHPDLVIIAPAQPFEHAVAHWLCHNCIPMPTEPTDENREQLETALALGWRPHIRDSISTN